MTTPNLRYDRMVEEALRGVVRQTLNEVALHGLPSDHHFYVTFETTHKGVEIPDYLRQRYPSEMTIVLQHQFYGLKISEVQFSVTLSFNNTPERLVIPFDAIRIFADPSVSFALQFEGPDGDDLPGDDEFDEAALDALISETEKALSERGRGIQNGKGKNSTGNGNGGSKKEPAASDDDSAKKGEVVSLADFRKKSTDKEK